MVPNGLPDVSFHDAEVTAIRFDRAGPNLEFEVDVVFPEARTVRLRFDAVSEIELHGFNEQNVLFDLKVAAADDGLEVILESSYGLAGRFRCTSLRTL